MKENSSFKDIRIKMNEAILGERKKRWKKALVACIEDSLAIRRPHTPKKKKIIKIENNQ